MKQNWLVVFVIVILLTITILANTGLLPSSIRQLYDFPYGDKAGHFLLMGLANFVIARSLLATHPELRPVSVIWKVSLAFALFVTIEELSQQFFARRTFSVLDLAFSYAGIFLSALGLYFIKR